MTTRRVRFVWAMVLPWCAMASLMARPLGQPTPAPCCVDGACAPSGLWGFHPGKWRRWPGTEEQTPRARRGGPRTGPQIPSVDKPSPEYEDQAAPEKVEALEDSPEDQRNRSRVEAPGLPPFGEAGEGPAPRGPEAGRPAPEGATPRPELPRAPRPGFMNDDPGGLPFGNPAPAEGGPARLPFGQPAARPTNAPSPARDLFPSLGRPQQQGLQPYGDDAPPALPFAIPSEAPRRVAAVQQPARVMRRQLARPVVQQASHVQALPSRVFHHRPAPTTVRPVVKTLGHQGDAPPVMPALFETP